MTKRKKFFSREVVLLLISLISLIMMSSSAVMMAEYSRHVEDQAGAMGVMYSDGVAANLKAAIVSYENKVSQVTNTLTQTPVESAADLAARLRKVRHSGDFNELMFTRFFKDGTEYDTNGEPFDISLENRSIVELSKHGTVSCAGVITDRRYSISAVAFCVPIEKCDYADTVVYFVPAKNVVSLSSFETNLFDTSRIAAVCSEEGEVLEILYQTEEQLQEHNNIFEALRGLINDKSTLDSMRSQVSSGVSGAHSVQIDGESHVVSVSSIKENMANPFAIVAVYQSSSIHNAGYTAIRATLAILIIFSVMLISMTLYSFINQRRQERRLLTINDTDATLDCPTRVKYERVGADILNRNKATAFAVVVVDMKNYSYIADQLGVESITQVLLYLKLLYSRMLRVDEIYGYAGSGRFMLLLHYRDPDSLAKRLKSVSSLATSYSGQLPAGYHLSLYGGIYRTDRNMTDQIAKMIELAVSAETALNFPYDFGSFRMYDERIHSSNVQNEYIEVHMENALTNHHFQVFYQPKYNIGSDRPDGCEALVRWYNPEQDNYMQPGVFLPLFEANRFIIKLDHYVYEQVCIYIEEAVSRGQDLYPVSVNVSRITATETDFISYYIDVKKKHNIADGFLTIEFTESFAYEDYNMLREIVNTLHKNGFKCSIDDFGSGFSSYNILKELPMDEIKLDQFFIGRGLSSDRDYKILSSVIKLGRELNMKVTQEGVETIEQLELLKKLGCQVIQGYYYSKPLCMSEYIDFISKKTHSEAFVNRL